MAFITAEPVPREGELNAVVGRYPALPASGSYGVVTLPSIVFPLPAAYMKENSRSAACQVQALQYLHQLTQSHGELSTPPSPFR